MLTIREVDKSYFPLYDQVTQNVEVSSVYKVIRADGGLGGLVLEEVRTDPYVRDLSVYERACDLENMFDLKNWRFYMAFDGDIPIGAATVAGKTEDLHLLGGMPDACVLWDIRLNDKYKHQGLGRELFDLAVSGARADGYKKMLIECQNNNVTACRFYRRQGAELTKIDMNAYCSEEGLEDEVQFIWTLDLIR